MLDSRTYYGALNATNFLQTLEKCRSLGKAGCVCKCHPSAQAQRWWR